MVKYTQGHLNEKCKVAISNVNKYKHLKTKVHKNAADKEGNLYYRELRQNITVVNIMPYNNLLGHIRRMSVHMGSGMSS